MHSCIRLDVYWIDWVPTHVRYIKGMQPQGGWLFEWNGDACMPYSCLFVSKQRVHKMLSSTQHVGVIGWFFDMWQLSVSMSENLSKRQDSLIVRVQQDQRVQRIRAMPSSTCYSSWLQSSMGGILMRKKKTFCVWFLHVQVGRPQQYIVGRVERLLDSDCGDAMDKG